MKAFLLALLTAFIVTPVFAQDNATPAQQPLKENRIMPAPAPTPMPGGAMGEGMAPQPAPMRMNPDLLPPPPGGAAEMGTGGARIQQQPAPMPQGGFAAPQPQPAPDQGARPMYHTPPYTPPTPEQLENARIAQEMLEESYWSSMLIGSAPILLILIVGGLFFFVKMKNDTKLAKSYIESAGDSKLIQERQRLMLDHIASIDKNLQIIVQKLDKLP